VPSGHTERRTERENLPSTRCGPGSRTRLIRGKKSARRTRQSPCGDRSFHHAPHRLLLIRRASATGMVTFLDGRGEPGRQKGWVLGGKKGQSDGCVFHGRGGVWRRSAPYRSWDFFSVSPPTCSLLAGDSDRLFAKILSSYLRPTGTAKFWVLGWRCNWPRTPLVCDLICARGPLRIGAHKNPAEFCAPVVYPAVRRVHPDRATAMRAHRQG
jgi:hypothetical protein